MLGIISKHLNTPSFIQCWLVWLKKRNWLYYCRQCCRGDECWHLVKFCILVITWFWCCGKLVWVKTLIIRRIWNIILLAGRVYVTVSWQQKKIVNHIWHALSVSDVLLSDVGFSYSTDLLVDQCGLDCAHAGYRLWRTRRHVSLLWLHSHYT